MNEDIRKNEIRDDELENVSGGTDVEVQNDYSDNPGVLPDIFVVPNPELPQS